MNFVAVFITIISSAAKGEPTIKPAALLWINLIMDSLGALSLVHTCSLTTQASEKPDNKILKQRPHKRSAHMLNADLQLYIIIQTVYQVVILVVIEQILDPRLLNSEIGHEAGELQTHVSTIVFSSFVLLQVSNQVACRTLRHELSLFEGILRNRLFILIQILIIIVQILIVQFVYRPFELSPLNVFEWGIYVLLTNSLLLDCRSIESSIRLYG